MAGFYRADVAQLRSLAGVMGKAATTLEMQGMQLSGLVNNTTAWTGSDAQRFKRDSNSSHRPLTLKAGVPYAQAVEDASKFSQGMRIAGGIAGPLSIAGGIHDMIAPSHDGWRGTGDRVAGGLSVVGGVGGMMLMTAGGAAMLGPIGA